MKIAENIKTIRQFLTAIRTNHKIVFVPTMGNLHQGHLELVRKAQQISPQVVVSIFVNPLQFGPKEDLACYPRTFQEDCDKLAALQVPFLFAPNLEEIYPNAQEQTRVNVPGLSDDLCGAFRPGFFYGITTVVTKLFNIVQPDVALFGEKDFQQLFIIKKMVKDLNFPIEIISVPTARETDGLAMSSRNQYLQANERLLASHIFAALERIAKGLKQKNKPSHLLKEAEAALKSNFKVDYISIRNRQTLEPAAEGDKELIILIAAWLGKARLIDNLFVDL